MRLCKPPRFFINLFIIHEVAEPQTINFTSVRTAAQLFQKFSSALTNPDLGVSIHGSSSIKITFGPSGNVSR
ncbi:unknown [Bacteroides intestinalis CAG:315]|nr:unknown [Bacteroides intestinalis CAG:315]